MTTAATRMTRTTVEVLTLLLAAPAGDPPWAARIGELAGLGRSTVSQILARLTALGRVTPRMEEGPHPGRPARVFYELTPEGRNQTEAPVADGRSFDGWVRHWYSGNGCPACPRR